MNKIRIPRWIGTSSTAKSQVHVYCDASMKAYGAVAYVRVHSNGQWSARLLSGRSKVAPIKVVTIPLELCAIELGSKLLTRIKEIATFANAPVFLWTDSEIALYWIRKPTGELKTFVAKRVSRILQTITIEQSRHIRSEMNPADLLSRGVKTENLIDNKLWWNGPEMLSGDLENWPSWNGSTAPAELNERINEETKKPSVNINQVLLTTMTAKQDEIDVIDKFSCYRRACRVAAYVIRFCGRVYEPCRRRTGKELPLSKIYGASSWKSDAVDELSIDQLSVIIPRLSIMECENALNY